MSTKVTTDFYISEGIVEKMRKEHQITDMTSSSFIPRENSPFQPTFISMLRQKPVSSGPRRDAATTNGSTAAQPGCFAPQSPPSEGSSPFMTTSGEEDSEKFVYFGDSPSVTAPPNNPPLQRQKRMDGAVLELARLNRDAYANKHFLASQPVIERKNGNPPHTDEGIDFMRLDLRSLDYYLLTRTDPVIVAITQSTCFEFIRQKAGLSHGFNHPELTNRAASGEGQKATTAKHFVERVAHILIEYSMEKDTRSKKGKIEELATFIKAAHKGEEPFSQGIYFRNSLGGRKTTTSVLLERFCFEFSGFQNDLYCSSVFNPNKRMTQEEKDLTKSFSHIASKTTFDQWEKILRKEQGFLGKPGPVIQEQEQKQEIVTHSPR